jgi:hypothetical protein
MNPCSIVVSPSVSPFHAALLRTYPFLKCGSPRELQDKTELKPTWYAEGLSVRPLFVDN